MDDTRSWRPGETIPVRHVWRERVWFAHPAIVVEDTPDRLALYEPAGAVRRWSHFHFGTGHIEPPRPQRRHSTDALIILEPGAAHAVSLFWREGGGPFLCWYVDLQAPFRRAGGGIVTWDQQLDIVVTPDRLWSWKDEDHLAASVELGWISPGEAAEIRREGEAVVHRIEACAPPFDGSWNGWKAKPEWRLPALPDDWETAPSLERPAAPSA